MNETRDVPSGERCAFVVQTCGEARGAAIHDPVIGHDFVFNGRPCFVMHHDYSDAGLSGTAGWCGQLLLPGQKCQRRADAYIHQPCSRPAPQPAPVAQERAPKPEHTCAHCGDVVPHYTAHEVRGQDGVEEYTCSRRRRLTPQPAPPAPQPPEEEDRCYFCNGLKQHTEDCTRGRKPLAPPAPIATDAEPYVPDVPGEGQFWVHDFCDHDADPADTAACEIDSILSKLENRGTFGNEEPIAAHVARLRVAWDVLSKPAPMRAPMRATKPGPTQQTPREIHADGYDREWAEAEAKEERVRSARAPATAQLESDAEECGHQSRTT